MHKILAVLSWVLIFTQTSTFESHAALCWLGDGPSIEYRVKEADFIFEGIYIWSDNDKPQKQAVFRVTRVWKGDIGRWATVNHILNHQTESFYFKPGFSGLVIGSIRNDELHTDGCKMADVGKRKRKFKRTIRKLYNSTRP